MVDESRIGREAERLFGETVEGLVRERRLPGRWERFPAAVRSGCERSGAEGRRPSPALARARGLAEAERDPATDAVRLACDSFAARPKRVAGAGGCDVNADSGKIDGIGGGAGARTEAIRRAAPLIDAGDPAGRRAGLVAGLDAR